MISKQEIEHIAKLARIKLNEGEETKFQTELSDILSFVEKLNEADISKVDPLTGGTDFKNIYRGDEQDSKDLEDKQSEMIKMAPESEKGFIKVKSVFHD